MCGICGVIAAREGEDVTHTLERLTEALHHRGPDGCGFRFIRGRAAGLGHRRLSIVDLATGAQPMANEDERVWVTYNGEIYNHRELRSQLAALGHRFRTNADTEVLVHGFEAWGPGLFGRLNGMYAFALFDGRTAPGELWLVRDPVGVKPLYLGRHRDTWWFASELAAARGCGLVEGELRPEALDEFLVYRFIPSPGTPFRSVWKVPPSHYCRLPLARLPQEPTFERFDPQFVPPVLPRSDAEWREALRAALVAAVRRQLMSDVPVGTLLSGGVDSTAVSRVMRDELPEPPHAFAVGFAGDRGGGELALARQAAVALAVPLTEVAVTSDEYLAAWLNQVSHLGEPIANTGSLLVALLCRAVRRTHKVVLTGQGADEALGGYPRHAAERLYPVARMLAPLLRLVPERLGTSDRVARARRVASEPDRARRFTEILAVFSPHEAARLTGHPVDPERLAAPVRRWLDQRPDDGDSANALLFVDTRLSLADDLLTVADHMAMASSVELRVPFLDLELLALVERMPSRYKISRLGERKWLYRRAVRPLLPEGLRGPLLGWRARTGAKLGFTTPLDSWFRRWMARDAEAFLLGSEARLPGYVHGDQLRTYVHLVRQRSLPRSRQLMALFVLESWLRGVQAS
jgi:asparagine synthase (glutamine-hydrolysing)